MWCVTVITVAGLAVSIMNPAVRSYVPAFLDGLASPSLELERPWDPGDLELVLTGIITAGMGGFWSLFYSYWVLGKGCS